jgi:hypothetical protein
MVCTKALLKIQSELEVVTSEGKSFIIHVHLKPCAIYHCHLTQHKIQHHTASISRYVYTCDILFTHAHVLLTYAHVCICMILATNLSPVIYPTTLMFMLVCNYIHPIYTCTISLIHSTHYAASFMPTCMYEFESYGSTIITIYRRN